MAKSKGKELVEELLEGPEALPKLEGLVMGVLVGWSEAGQPLVEFTGSPGREPVEARSLTVIDEDALGSAAALLFEAGDPARPLVVGVVQEAPRQPATNDLQALHADVDGETVTLSADQQLVLRCGKASLTLTRAGKILLRGSYLLSRSSGVNRIKGGSVQIN